MLADRLNPSLELLRLQLARGPLPAWWADVVSAGLALLPQRWRQALVDRRLALGLAIRGGELDVCQIESARASSIGPLPLDDETILQALSDRMASTELPRWLLLDASQVLRRRFPLPAAAESRLREVLSHEIDRHTPFTLDQVAFAGRVVSRDIVARTLQVELVVMPQTQLELALTRLGPLAQGLAGVDVADGEALLGINLLPAAQRRRRIDPTRRRQLELLASAAILLFAALLMSLNNRRVALDALRADVEAANTEVRQVRALRNQLQASAQAANFLAEARAARPTQLEVLAELTRRFPDDTTLEKIAVNDNKLTLVGKSRAPEALVSLLQDSRLLTKPALAGAVQTDARSGRERFTLTATLLSPEAGDGTP